MKFFIPYKFRLLLYAVVSLLIFNTACVSSRYVPEGGYLLDKVNITGVDTVEAINQSVLEKYVRQMPNHKVLWKVKFRLGLYNMAGGDTTKWYNRWWRRMGEPPVVYDSILMRQSQDQLHRALVNQGFLDAKVAGDTVVDEKKRKIKVNYIIIPGTPHVIKSITYNLPQDTIGELLLEDSVNFPVKTGQFLDRALLEKQREYIVSRLRNHGYYAYSKDLITFNADTTHGSKDVDLTMTVSTKAGIDSERGISANSNFIVRKVVYVTDYAPSTLGEPWDITPLHSETYKGIEIWYGEDKYLRPSLLYENCFIVPGEPYRQKDVNRTYQALGRMSILQFIDIKFHPVGSVNGTGLLDCYIVLRPAKSQTLGASIEGTNSAGDLGIAVGMNYTHRNIGRGSETLSAKLRGAYESVSGNLNGLLHNRYMEYGVDVGLDFPKFKAPFLKESFKRKINASTDLRVSLNYQERPEYTRIVSTAGWNYKWTERNTHKRHIFTPIDINYVYLPESTSDFLNQIAPDNPLLRYSYEDHFIMRMGYGFYYTNKNTEQNRKFQRNIFNWRINVETAGNLLFLLNTIITHRDFHTNPYKIFGIHYSQYVRGDADYSLVHFFTPRHSLAFHAGAGIGVPYGNSVALPFEKRFYGGGANGVRGWAVRTLGPGSYVGGNSLSDFIHQCGDIRLDFSVEYRPKLFWLIEGAVFADAGNIWTIRDYPSQPGGVFRFDSFYKQIAASYGVGIRLDFSYFLLRFDVAMKAHNPAQNAEHWPLFNPNWRRDHAFHFSIGYPF